MEKKQRIAILIDGSNFYFKLKSQGIHNLLKFNFALFAKILARSNKLVECCYYVGRVKQDGSKKSQELFDGQQKLLSSLKKAKFKYVLGYLQKSDGVFHEKGVDVQIAVDMVVFSYEKLCDRIILVSSDADLLPAIKKAQEKGLVVEYVGLSTKPSVTMVSVCKESTLLKKADLEKFV